MTVLNGSPLLLREVAAGDEEYKIEKSLRFYKEDTPQLRGSRNTKGNTRIWTLSFWLKQNPLASGSGNFICGVYGGGYEFFITFQADGEFQVYFDGNKTLKTNAYYRDPAAWQHFVLSVNTTQAIDTERAKLYVNGKQVTSFASASYPTQNAELHWNVNKDHYIGSRRDTSNYGSFLLADCQFIDGLQLSSAALGSFDSTGVWNPKAFALPQPNQNQDYSDSSNWSVVSGTLTNIEGAFKGNFGVWGPSLSSDVSDMTFTPDTEIDCNVGVTVGNWGAQGTIIINKGETDEVRTALTTSYAEWCPAPTSRKIKNISIVTTSGTVALTGFKVDGVELVDDKTDPDTRNNPNNGTVWSDHMTGSANSGAPVTRIFDGKPIGGSGNHSFANDGNHITFIPPSTITGTKIEIHTEVKGSITGTNDLKVNGTSIFNAVKTKLGENTEGWYDIGTSIDSTDGIYFGREDTNNKTFAHAIRVDGNILIDSTVDNSFHLKSNDTSSNRYLGKDTLNGKIEDATGGLPIYNTKAGTNDNEIDYGDVKDTGYRTDSSAGTTDGAGLVLAVPGDTIADVHHNINTGSSEVTLTAVNDAVAASTYSRFYGSSLDLDGNSYVRFESSDIEFGTNDFTIEFWFYSDTNASIDEGLFTTSSTSSLNQGSENNVSIIRWSGASGVREITCRFYGQGVQFNSNFVENQWNHFACSRTSGTLNVFLNGIKRDSASCTADISGEAHGFIGGYYAANQSFTGSIQDFRIYRSAKYTSNFTVPTRNDFTVTNLIHGTSTGVTTGGAWSTAFKDGSATSYNGADDWVISSGDSASTNGNNNRIYIDTGALGDAYELTCTDTGGANDIYFAHQNSDDPSSTSGWDLVQNNNTKIVFTAAGANCDGTTVSHKRYVRLEGAGSGHVTITITGVLGLDKGTSANAADIDSLVDSPTNYGDEDTGAGGEVRGNYCTLNPLAVDYGTFGQGNLQYKGADTWGKTWATMTYPKTGKWYIEAEHKGANSGSQHGNITAWIGIGKSQNKVDVDWGNTNTFTVHDTGHYNNFSASSAGTITKPANGDVYGIIWDAGARKLSIFRNNTVLLDEIDCTSNISTDDTVFFATGSYYSYQGWQDFNFGQRAFKYNRGVTENCKTLCTQNLPDTFSGEDAGIVNNPSKYFDVKLYIGDDTTDGSKKIKLPFSPDLAWLKSRSVGYDHRIFDRIRGQGSLVANKTDAVYSDAWSSLTTFDSDGISIEESAESYNASGKTYVTWAWDAGTTASSNDSGSIDVASGNQWVNTAAGFSITKYTGTGSSATVGHGLGAKPKFIIVRRADSATGGDWAVQHTSLSADKVMWLNKDDAAYTDTGDHWLDAEPTDTVFTIKDSANVNASSGTYMAYCWTDIPGYSAFGSYKANNSNNGPMINLGFQPRWIMFKNRSSDWGWYIHDTERSVDNIATEHLIANLHNAEATYDIVDILSNGFKLKENDEQYNYQTDLYIYAAFAEFPFKLARAR